MASIAEVIMWGHKALSELSQASQQLLQAKIAVQDARQAINSIRTTSVDLGEVAVRFNWMEESIDEALSHIPKNNEDIELYISTVR